MKNAAMIPPPNTLPAPEKSPPLPVGCGSRYRFMECPRTIRTIPSPLARLKYPSPRVLLTLDPLLLSSLFILRTSFAYLVEHGDQPLPESKRQDQSRCKRRVAEILKPVQSHRGK